MALAVLLAFRAIALTNQRWVGIAETNCRSMRVKPVNGEQTLNVWVYGFFSDYKKGFGGQFGIQTDRKDKSASGWDEHEKLQQHESQTGLQTKGIWELKSCSEVPH